MRRKSILFIDNLLRIESQRSQQFFYTILRECLYLAGGNVNPHGGDLVTDRGLKESFSLDVFLDKCDLSHWTQGYHGISQEAQDYFTENLPEDVLAIGYEMPPWLTSILDRTGTPYITFQVSPLRFGRDLYVALRSNIPDVGSMASRISVKDDELYLEAALMKARVQHANHRRNNFMDKKRLVFIGQTGTDASLLSANGRLLDVKLYADEIRRSASSLHLVYKPHPYARGFARKERRALEEIVGYRVSQVGSNIYNILAGDPHSSFLTISSGVSQEAKYFRRHAATLYHPVCEVHTTKGLAPPGAHYQVHFSEFFSPRFWNHLLYGEDSGFSTAIGPTLATNEFRHAFGKWWGYDTYMVDNDPFWRLILTGGAKSMVRRFRSYLRLRVESLRSQGQGTNARKRS